MCTPAQWLAKRNIDAAVSEPTDPGAYAGDTNVLHAEHKIKLLRFEEWEEHKRNTNKAILACFDKDLLVEIETDGLLIGFTPYEVYQYMWSNFIQAKDKDREILHARELLKVEYDPDKIPQHYYKAINEARELLTGLRETVTDDEVIRNAYATFEKNIDLKDACRDWNRGRAGGTTWTDMKKHFSKEIQLNRTDPANHETERTSKCGDGTNDGRREQSKGPTRNYNPTNKKDPGTRRETQSTIGKQCDKQHPRTDPSVDRHQRQQ